MPSYVLSPRALADLDEIWDYSVENWGAEQAERYIGEIRKAIETLERDPRRGRSCDEVRPGYRKYPAGSHVIFFRLAEEKIDVIRILHQRMDFDQHL
jgi:toxin ParE1/3/4